MKLFIILTTAIYILQFVIIIFIYLGERTFNSDRLKDYIFKSKRNFQLSFIPFYWIYKSIIILKHAMGIEYNAHWEKIDKIRKPDGY
jgi:hypothetical protein